MSWTAIAAVSENGVIGADGAIPWHLPEDFKWFKAVTMGHVLVMGRKTFESIGRPLPGRETVVLSRGEWRHPGVRVARSLDDVPAQAAGERVFICGGAEVYRQALPRCAELLLTHVSREVAGDAHFPEYAREFEPVETVMETGAFRVVRYRRRAGAEVLG